MESLLSFFYGASMKITDELMDVPNDYTYLKFLFQGLTLILHVLCAYKDVLYSFIFLFITAGSYFAGSIDEPYWFLLAGIIISIFIYQISKEDNNLLEILKDGSIIISILCIVIFIGSIIEGFLFTTETDLKKIIMSIISLILCVIIVYIIQIYKKDYNISQTIENIFIFSVGYLVIRIISKTYLYNTQNTLADIINNKEESL